MINCLFFINSVENAQVTRVDVSEQVWSRYVDAGSSPGAPLVREERREEEGGGGRLLVNFPDTNTANNGLAGTTHTDLLQIDDLQLTSNSISTARI